MIATQTTTIATKLSTEHNDWLRSLDFYTDELNILKGRLTEVAGKNTNHEASEGAELYENRFDIQKNNIHDLSHEIRRHLAEVAVQAKQMAGHIEVRMLERHGELREQYIALEKTIHDLRHEFYRYATRWM